MEKILAIIMAGGVGERLQPLTMVRAKPAVPFGGKFRLVDFTLSNCLNSGIRQVYVLTQYRSASLHSHIQEGWNISSAGLGEFIYCVPAQQKLGADWYSGTADAVRQNLDLTHHADLVLILSGDHIYKMNYQQMVAYHQARGASLTVSAIRVRREDAAGRLGVLQADENGRMVGFTEKPAEPKTVPGSPDYALASMGVYLFRADFLKKVLEGDKADFGRDIIPGLVEQCQDIFVYDYGKENRIEDFVFEVNQGKRSKNLVERAPDSDYWLDVGTLDAYYDASMDLVSVNPRLNLYGEKWPIRTYHRQLPPSKYILDGTAMESMVSDGCIISGGTVRRSILSPGVVIERDARIEESVVFDDVIIEPRVQVKRAIIDKEVVIRAGVSIGYDHEADRKKGCTVSPNGVVVVPRGAELTTDLK